MLSSAQLKEAFDGIDKDRSGELDFGEVVALAKSLGEAVDKATLEGMFKQIDTNSDGKLSFEEFLAWYRVGKGSKMGNLIKYHLEVQKGFRKAKDKLKGVTKAEGEVTRLLDIEIIDGNSNKSSVDLSISSGAENKRIPEIISKVFPMYDDKRTYFYAVLGCKDAEKVQTAINNFVGEWLIFLGEADSDYGTAVKDLNIKSGVYKNKKVVLIADLTKSEITVSVHENIEEMKPMIASIRPQGTVSVATDMTLKDVVSKVTRSENLTEEEKEKTLDETNLLRLFLSGLSLRAKVDCMEANKKVVRENLLNMLYDAKYLPKGLRWALLGFNNCIFRMNMSSDKTFDMVMEFLNKVQPDIPDGADLVDEVGLLLDEHQLLRMYFELPFCRNVVDAIKEYGNCDIEVGILSPAFQAGVKLQTEGVKELVEHVLEGMVDNDQ